MATIRHESGASASGGERKATNPTVAISRAAASTPIGGSSMDCGGRGSNAMLAV
jgi:hypothetical protein